MIFLAAREFLYEMTVKGITIEWISLSFVFIHKLYLLKHVGGYIESASHLSCSIEWYFLAIFVNKSMAGKGPICGTPKYQSAYFQNSQIGTRAHQARVPLYGK